MFLVRKPTALVCLLLSLAGCGGGSANVDTSLPANDPTSIIGTWTARSLVEGRAAQTCPATLTTPATASMQAFALSCTGTESFVFYPNGKCRVNGSDAVYPYQVDATNQVLVYGLPQPQTGTTTNASGSLRANGVLDLASNTLSIVLFGAPAVNLIYQRSVNSR